LHDFEPASHRVEPGDLAEIDRWILDRTRRLVARCREAYLSYDFHVVVHALNNFCSTDLSALYLDIAKDRLYCSAVDARGRRASQTALSQILEDLTRLMAPILSFTADEIWGYLPKVAGREESVFLSDFPAVAEGELDDGLAATWERMLEVRAAVTKALEKERQEGRIGHSLDAGIRLGFDHDGSLAALLAPRLDDLPALFIVSHVALDPALPKSAESPLVPGLRIAIDPAPGAKCARCWNYRTTVGEVADHPTICSRCAAVVTGAA
ncbi:MAG: class I tRNA ligase family protein, partial [Candidatus Binatia bacterium]